MEIKSTLAEALNCLRGALSLYPPRGDVEFSALRWKLYATLQNVLDAVAMIISDLGLRKPGSYSDLGSVLHEVNVISAEARSTLREVALTRNILAYAYRRLKLEDLSKIVEGLLPKAKKLIELLLQVVEEKSLDPLRGEGL